MGVDGKTKQWVRVGTYGGKLAENITQATARDVMAEAMVRCEETGVYQMVMSVHDEIVAETNENEGSLEEFIGIVSANPVWAQDLPIRAEGWRGRRYRK
jgi:DNA polymerase